MTVFISFVYALDLKGALITQLFACDSGPLGDELLNEYSERMEYYEARHPPNFSVPAPILNAEFHPWFEDSPLHSCVIINDSNRGMVAIWDYNFDRCCDFNYACGAYVNERQIKEGQALWCDKEV